MDGVGRPGNKRLIRELELFNESPPAGVSLYFTDERHEVLEAQIIAGKESLYDGGTFKLRIKIPKEYPFRPPVVRFTTPIYHPNVDENGRICHDILSQSSEGKYNVRVTFRDIFREIQLMLRYPNHDDPVRHEVANLYHLNKTLYDHTVREHTLKYATEWVGGRPVDANSRPSTDAISVQKAGTGCSDVLQSDSNPECGPPGIKVSPQSL